MPYARRADWRRNANLLRKLTDGGDLVGLFRRSGGDEMEVNISDIGELLLASRVRAVEEEAAQLTASQLGSMRVQLSGMHSLTQATLEHAGEADADAHRLRLRLRFAHLNATITLQVAPLVWLLLGNQRPSPSLTLRVELRDVDVNSVLHAGMDAERLTYLPQDEARQLGCTLPLLLETAVHSAHATAAYFGTACRVLSGHHPPRSTLDDATCASLPYEEVARGSMLLGPALRATRSRWLNAYWRGLLETQDREATCARGRPSERPSPPSPYGWLDDLADMTG
jgi:hypothetical protein